MRDKVELLKKLRALAVQGVGGERETAEKLFNKLMEKFDLTETDIDDDKVECFEFTFHGSRERSLLLQVMYKTLDSVENVGQLRSVETGHILRSMLGVWCTKAQQLEIQFMFDFYSELYRREEEFFFDTFIQVHELFGDTPCGNSKELSEDEAIKMRNLSAGMEKATMTKMIEER